MLIIHKYFLILVFSMLVFSVKGQEPKNYKDTQVKFEVLSARLMTTKEQIKQGDNIGIDVLVRFRLSNTGQKPIYYYTNWKDDITPYGHTIKETEKGIVWFKSLESVSDKSLGISKVTLGDGGTWLRLSSGTAIEWESGDSTTGAGEKRAQTFFMKVGEKGIITEVFSDFYTVPTRNPK